MLVTLQGEGPVSHRVYRGVRRAILDGRLTAGARLPSTRALAAELGLSRKAVASAFTRLNDEGYVEGRVGAGTFVSPTLPDVAFAPSRRRRAPAAHAAAGLRLSSFARRALAQSPWPPPGRRVKPGLRFDFHYGSPAITDFPQSIWGRIAARRARQRSVASLRYGRTLGYGPLQRAIAEYLSRARGVTASEANVVIVNGSQHAIDIIARLLVDPGDRVVVEEPGYQGARQAFAAAGARLVGGRVDEAGLDVSRLPRGVPVRLAYVTPSHQFPLGGVLPLPRRLELLRWAEDVRALVVEDDYDSEFQYEGRPVEAVQGLDPAGRVLYVGTFSKVLFPSMRLAYLIAPEPLVPTIAALKFLTHTHTPTFEQEVLADFIAEGHFERHLRRTRRRNASRRRALLEALSDTLGDRVEIAGANAGLHVVVWLRDLDPSRLPDLRERAAARGVGLYPVAPYYMKPPARAGLLFGYASLTESDIREGVAVLGDVLRSLS
jgi:GntR family transcriptional regulator/MocR family aminotransferase